MAERDYNTGEGLLMKGYPTDLDLFKKILYYHGCHPAATERILVRLMEKRYDKMTVTPTLPFQDIIRQLKLCGVEMSIIEPQKDWEPLYNDGPWPEEAIPTTEQIRNGLGF